MADKPELKLRPHQQQAMDYLRANPDILAPFFRHWRESLGFQLAARRRGASTAIYLADAIEICNRGNE